MNIQYVVDGELENVLITKVTYALVSGLQEHKVNLFLSGGSWVRLYQQIFQQVLNSDVKIANLTLYQVDERYNADPLHRDSNQKNILENTPIFDQLIARGGRVHFILGEDNLDKTVYKYATIIKDALDANDINIGLFGVGEDCHIAGMKPFANIENQTKESYMQLLKSREYVVTFDADDYKGRITINFEALKSMNKSFVYMSGEQKRSALNALAKGTSDLLLSPANILHQMDDVTVYTDVSR